MPKDRSERKTYRKSPGRQYNYETDPLRSRTGHSQSGRVENGRVGTTGRISTQIRPDPRRTRQLLRQSILASKAHPATSDEEHVEQQEAEQPFQHPPQYDQEISRRHPSRDHLPQQHIPSTPEVLMDRQREDEDSWRELEDIDPDLGYEDPHDARLVYTEGIPPRSSAFVPLTQNGRRMPTHTPTRSMRPIEEEVYDDDEYEDEYEDDDDRPPARRGVGKGNVSRRGLLVGLGLVAVGGTGVAAYELAPKIPQAVSTVGTNIEHQLQDAFNKGLQQGADNVRREFVTTLENLEGFSLQGALSAVKLMRAAFDTFVLPIITFGATLTGDFLSAMLRAVQTARGLLAQSFQDNPTLIAVQKVLQSWVDQASNMPKQLAAITDADLDGAQAYLRALQRKIDEEKAKLNNTGQKATPTVRPTPTPKH
jgi:hypothetical protein